MTDKDFTPTTLPRAPLGSKRGWPTISGQVPPDVARRLERYAFDQGQHKGDVLHAALERYLDTEAA